MSSSRKAPRYAVSFTKFRRLQLTAISSLRLHFTAEECTAPVDAKLIAIALECALVEARYADAVALSGALLEQQYENPRSYRLAAQIAALVKKVPFNCPELDPDAKALEKFLQNEAECRAFNEVLNNFNAFYNGTLHNAELCEDAQRIFTLLHSARTHMYKALGNKPPLGRIYGMCRFGSGSSVKVHGEATHLLRKLTSDVWTVSHAASSHARAALKAAPMAWYALGLDPSVIPQLYADDQALYSTHPSMFYADTPIGASSEDAFDDAFLKRIEYADYDLITCVPKNADCSRTVGTQPLLNMFLQLGAGDYLRDYVLRDRCGIDIRTAQTEVNGPLALLASFCSGLTLATIDLSSASDMLIIALMRFLLPPQWFAFLNSIRTPSYRMPWDQPGQETRYEKFCAMGNGFCFPLETLVFWSLTQAVYDYNCTPDRTCAVYGDDIIVYQSAALELIELLSCVGFSTNVQKTFVFGPFRESCGQDFFNGVNVRPVVLDEIIEHESQAYHIINSLQRKGYTYLAEQMRNVLPEGALKRPYPGPTTTALEVPLDEFMASRHAVWTRPKDEKEPWYQSWSWKEFLPIAISDYDEYDAAGHMPSALSGASSGLDGVPTFALRRKTSVFVRRVAHG